MSSGSGKPSFSARLGVLECPRVLALPQEDFGELAVRRPVIRIDLQHFPESGDRRRELTLLQPEEPQLQVEVEFHLALLSEGRRDVRRPLRHAFHQLRVGFHELTLQAIRAGKLNLDVGSRRINVRGRGESLESLVEAAGIEIRQRRD